MQQAGKQLVFKIIFEQYILKKKKKTPLKFICYIFNFRSTSEPNRVQSQNLPSGSTYLPNHASSSSSVLDHSNAVNKSNVISQRNDHINSTYPSISSTSITYPTSQKYSTYNQDEYNADYSVNLPPTSTGKK